MEVIMSTEYLLFFLLHVAEVQYLHFPHGLLSACQEAALLKRRYCFVFFPNLETTKDSVSRTSCQCQTLFSVIRITLTTCFCEQTEVEL